MLSTENFGVYKTEAKERIERRERLPALRNREIQEEHIEIYGGLKEEIGMQTNLHGPLGYAKTLKLRFRVGHLDLPQRRDMPVDARRRKKMHRCVFVAKQKGVELT